MTLELRPIVETSYRKFTVVGNFAFVDPFSGRARKGFQFAPSGDRIWCRPG